VSGGGLKTQRAWATYDGPWPNLPMTPTGNARELPVLVVPEAAYANCEHDWFHFGVNAKWCENCGRLRLKLDKQTRGPRILRAAKEQPK
jgi:hypothetical protein